MSISERIESLDENRMAAFVMSAVVGGLGALLSIVALVVWLNSDPTRLLEPEIPGYDGLPPGGASLANKANLQGIYESFDGTAPEIEGHWPSFRGPNFDNIVTDSPPLANEWDGDGPEILWSKEIGGGYAAPSVLNSVVYLMDYNEEERMDVLRAFSLADGTELWRRSYKVMIKRNHGMSRTIPAVNEDFIVTIGPKCHVVCLDTESGEFKWGLDLQSDYGTKEPLWYAAQCPLLEGNTVILAPCGEDFLMMGVDCTTGETLWTTPNDSEWDMSHSSIMPMTVLGKKMYVYAALGGVVAVSAEPEDVGEIMWEVPWIAKVVSPSPVQSSESQILMTAGYGTGNMMLDISESGGKYAVNIVYSQAPGEGLSCEQQTPVYANGLFYGIIPKDGGSLKMQFTAYNPDGTLKWSSGSDNRFGLGPFMLADDKFYILDDHGVLTMLKSSDSEYIQLGQAQVLKGHDPWGPMALAGSRMLLRDMDHLICVELGAI